MNGTDCLMDLKAQLLHEMNEENLFIFCSALLETRVIVPSEFDLDGFDIQKLFTLKQGDVIEGDALKSRPILVEWDGKNWMPVYLEKSAMPEQYRSSCVHMSGQDAVVLAHEQNDCDGLMLDPDGRFLPLPLFYLDELIEMRKENKGE